MRNARTIVSLLGVLLCIPVASLAQSTNATLMGRVLDPTKAAVAGASIEVTNVDTNVSYKESTDSEGRFTIPDLPPGNYRVSVAKTGFKSVVKPDVALHVQDVIALNFDLSLGSISEVVTVAGGAPLIDTENASVSTVVDRLFVENLPLNGRSFQALINLTPGVVLTAANFAQPGQFSINGQRSDANYFTVDGVSANVAASTGVPLVQYGAGVYPALSASGGTNSLVSIEALEEFRVQTSTFAPEYGRTPGGQISVLTRSGTNQFHGTGFEYLRNDVLDANDWFANAAGVKKSPLRQNDFGGVFSGPIVKDRLFFFFSYEGLRLRLPQTRTTPVPSTTLRQNATPAMRAIMAAFPIPNGPDVGNGLQNFTGSFTNPSSFNATSLRIDYSVSKRWTIFGRYNYAPSSTDTRGSTGENLDPSQIDHFKTKTQTLTLGARTAVSPRVANEIRFNYSRVSASTIAELDNFGSAVPFSSSLVLPPGFTFSNTLVDVNFNAFLSPALFEVGLFSRNLQRQLNFVDNVSYTVASHVLKFGVDYRRLSPAQHPAAYSQLVAFGSPMSAAAGTADLAEVFATQPAINFIFTNVSLFAQDTWKVTRRLALTYGLRWDYNPVPGTAEGTPSPFTLAGLGSGVQVNPVTALLAPAGTALYQSSHKDFAPRVGIAYELRDDPRWTSVIRGGFGLFNNISSSIYGDASGGYPYTALKLLFGPNYPSPLAAPALGSANPPFGRISTTDPNLKTPYSLQWNGAFEQQLGGKQSVSVSYVGAAGRRLIYQNSFFSFNPGANFSTVTLSLNGATSSYNALQIKFRRQVTHGLAVLASYGWSHALDADSNTEGGVALQRGNADFDIRHSFTMGATYELPKPRWGGFAGTVLKNWTLDSTIYARTAMPVDPFAGANLLPFFLARPNVVAGQPLYLDDSNAPGGRRINGKAFMPATDQQGNLVQGNLGRNRLRGLSAWQCDFAVRRDFHLWERLSLQFRAEMFNIFNHPNFGLPQRFLFDPQFGVPTQTLAQSLGSGGVNGGFNPLYQIGGPRSIQLAWKVQF